MAAKTWLSFEVEAAETSGVCLVRVVHNSGDGASIDVDGDGGDDDGRDGGGIDGSGNDRGVVGIVALRRVPCGAVESACSASERSGCTLGVLLN